MNFFFFSLIAILVILILFISKRVTLTLACVGIKDYQTDLNHYLIHPPPLPITTFTKISTATLYFSMATSYPSTPFPNPESLSQWLKPRLAHDSLASWGTKNLHSLWLELNQGESTISDSTPPMRTVHCVVVRIINPTTNRILLESHQDLTDGSTRARGRPLSEKMKPGEGVEDAALRAVKEELGSKWVATVVAGTYKIKEEERESGSYPGLGCRYVLHRVDAKVEGLPDGEFVTAEEEYGDCCEEVVGRAVHVKKHYWKWAKSNYVEDD